MCLFAFTSVLFLLHFFYNKTKRNKYLSYEIKNDWFLPILLIIKPSILEHYHNITVNIFMKEVKINKSRQIFAIGTSHHLVLKENLKRYSKELKEPLIGCIFFFFLDK